GEEVALEAAEGGVGAGAGGQAHVARAWVEVGADLVVGARGAEEAGRRRQLGAEAGAALGGREAGAAGAGGRRAAVEIGGAAAAVGAGEAHGDLVEPHAFVEVVLAVERVELEADAHDLAVPRG